MSNQTIVQSVGGYKAWITDGEYHRTDGPAITWGDGSSMWLINGKLHRLDGPAVESAYGTKRWYINGNLIYNNDFILKYYHD